MSSKKKKKEKKKSLRRVTFITEMDNLELFPVWAKVWTKAANQCWLKDKTWNEAEEVKWVIRERIEVKNKKKRGIQHIQLWRISDFSRLWNHDVNHTMLAVTDGRFFSRQVCAPDLRKCQAWPQCWWFLGFLNETWTNRAKQTQQIKTLNVI